jgi:hypothetical protein
MGDHQANLPVAYNVAHSTVHEAIFISINLLLLYFNCIRTTWSLFIFSLHLSTKSTNHLHFSKPNTSIKMRVSSIIALITLAAGPAAAAATAAPNARHNNDGQNDATPARTIPHTTPRATLTREARDFIDDMTSDLASVGQKITSHVGDAFDGDDDDDDDDDDDEDDTDDNDDDDSAAAPVPLAGAGVMLGAGLAALFMM